MRCPEHELTSEKALNYLFLPAKVASKKESTHEILDKVGHKDQLETNYNKTYLSRSDLISSSSSPLKFLNYVHPKSQQNTTKSPPPPPPSQQPSYHPYYYDSKSVLPLSRGPRQHSESDVGDEHGPLFIDQAPFRRNL